MTAVRRIDAIDVTRGAMMIAIVWVHVLTELEPGHPTALPLRMLLSSTIGFTTVSGCLVGWFAVVKRDRFDQVIARYTVQSAKLLFIAHPLLVAAIYGATGQAGLALRTTFITDTLAVLFLVLVPVIPAWSPRRRVATGIALIVANALLDEPLSHMPLLHDFACGTAPQLPHVLVGSYGALPLGGAFLIGSWLGTQLAGVRSDVERRAFVVRLLGLAFWLCGLALALVGAWLVARHVSPTVARWLYPDYEGSLYPGYLAGTMILLAIALTLRRPPQHLAAIGKASLCVYVAQYILSQTLPNLAGYRGALPPLAALGLCIIAVPLLAAVARAWNALTGR